MDKKTRKNRKKREKVNEGKEMKNLIEEANKKIKPISERNKAIIDNERNHKMASEITEAVLARARESHNDELSSYKKKNDSEFEQFNDYVVFADTSALLPYLEFNEKNDNDAIKKLRARIMSDVININSKRNKKKINTTGEIHREVTKKPVNKSEQKSESERMIEKSTDLSEKYTNLIEEQIYDVAKNGSYGNKVSDMYKKIWGELKNSKKIDKWSKIKTKYVNHADLSLKEWNEKWKTFPDKEKVKGPPEGSDIIILATIYKYKKKCKPTAVIFVTHDSDFAFFKDEIEDQLGIVVMSDIRYTDT